MGWVKTAVAGFLIYAVSATISIFFGHEIVEIILLFPSVIGFTLAALAVLDEKSPRFVDSVMERNASPEVRIGFAIIAVVGAIIVAVVASPFIPTPYVVPVVFVIVFVATSYAIPTKNDRKDEVDPIDMRDEFVSSMLSSGTPKLFKRKKDKDKSKKDEYMYEEYEEEEEK